MGKPRFKSHMGVMRTLDLCDECFERLARTSCMTCFYA